MNPVPANEVVRVGVDTLGEVIVVSRVLYEGGKGVRHMIVVGIREIVWMNNENGSLVGGVDAVSGHLRRCELMLDFVVDSHKFRVTGRGGLSGPLIDDLHLIRTKWSSSYK
jgi:hypothetical protein